MDEIVLIGVTKAFDEQNGLFRFDLSVPQGEACALLGPGGSGKSTVAALLTGQMAADEGTCTVRGLHAFSQRNKVSEVLGYVPAYDCFPPEARAEDFIKAAAALHGGFSTEKYSRLIEKMDINPLGRFASMTALNRRKMTLMMGLVYDSPILVLDEPFQGLDAFAAEAFMQVLEEEKKQGKTILLCVYKLAQAQRLCDTVALMRKGRLVFKQAAEKLKLSRQKVYYITFETVEEARAFSQEWGLGVDLIDTTAMVAIPGSPQALVKVLGKYNIRDLIGGREEGEESFLRDHGDEAI